MPAAWPVASLPQHEGRRPPAAQRRTDASKDATASRLREDNRQLRAQNAELRRANEALLGRLRESPLPATYGPP